MSASFVIVARKSEICARIGHDHDRRPECLNVKFGHSGRNGLGWPGKEGRTNYRSRSPTAPLAGAAPDRTHIPDQQQSHEIRNHGSR